ncbi:hypothetical protein SARC_09824 [Sphaeroforma arctica JP610]|uniref:Uncharacterized protein n=1 Tax=Sphaeroforma arctica JP610 TaxID=667725 RepID=A0A0L0FP23_9EUKA|nr:hypothetical protein SARC_09824 [Sphaeroforma arctica JP610]KNC77728.1 hypothetical protein SARC_09824 [Sphaeroforma arctica JP610]|eukprot:XP_014151630.1 hypothetical protein SARC_09824 [Sphaeroforma arctica JP610]
MPMPLNDTLEYRLLEEMLTQCRMPFAIKPRFLLHLVPIAPHRDTHEDTCLINWDPTKEPKYFIEEQDSAHMANDALNRANATMVSLYSKPMLSPVTPAFVALVKKKKLYSSDNSANTDNSGSNDNADISGCNDISDNCGSNDNYDISESTDNSDISEASNSGSSSSSSNDSKISYAEKRELDSDFLEGPIQVDKVYCRWSGECGDLNKCTKSYCGI